MCRKTEEVCRKNANICKKAEKVCRKNTNQLLNLICWNGLEPAAGDS